MSRNANSLRQFISVVKVFKYLPMVFECIHIKLAVVGVLAKELWINRLIGRRPSRTVRPQLLW